MVNNPFVDNQFTQKKKKSLETIFIFIIFLCAEKQAIFIIHVLIWSMEKTLEC